MAHFLVDENLSRVFAPKLRSLQVRAEDVREVGLQGREDGEILAYAITHRRALVTADLRFARRAALREQHAARFTSPESTRHTPAARRSLSGR